MTRGRRPNLTLEPSRQLLVQRAFRERKAAHLRNLEDAVQKLERENATLKRALGAKAEDEVDELINEKDQKDGVDEAQSAKRKRAKGTASQKADEDQTEPKSGGCCGSKQSSRDDAGGSSTSNVQSSNPSQPRAPAFCPRCFERDRNREEMSTAIGQVDFHLATLATAMVQLRTVLGRTGGPAVSSLPTPTSMEWSTSVGRSAAMGAGSNGKPDDEDLARTLTMFANPGAAAGDMAGPSSSSSSTAPSPAAYTLGSMSGATQNLIATMRRGQRRQTVGPAGFSSMPSPSASSSSRVTDSGAWGHENMSPPASHAHAHSTPSPASQYAGGAMGTSSSRSTVRQGSTGHGVPDYGHGMHVRRTSSSTDQGGALMPSPIEPPASSPHQSHVSQCATPGASSSSSSSSSHYVGLSLGHNDAAKRLSTSSSTSSSSNATSPYDTRTPHPQHHSSVDVQGRSRQSSLSGPQHRLSHSGPSSSSNSNVPSYMSLSGSMHGFGSVNGMSMPMPNPALANPTLESELGGAVAAAAAAAAAADAAATATGVGATSQYAPYPSQQQQMNGNGTNHGTASCPAHMADEACCLGLFKCDDDGRVLL